MGSFVIKAVRSAMATILIVGSIYVQHVARAQQAADRQAELRLSESIGSENAPNITESRKLFVTVLR
jgi:hypothetical protein